MSEKSLEIRFKKLEKSVFLIKMLLYIVTFAVMLLLLTVPYVCGGSSL